MNKSRFYSIILIVFLLSGCEKEALPLIPEEPVSEQITSLSFTMDGKTYFSDNLNAGGFGNRQINIKPYDTIIPGRKHTYGTGNYYWYGEKDSTLYNVFYNFLSINEPFNVEVSFSKKFHNNQLIHSPINLPSIPENHLELFKEGKHTFCIDLDKENTTDGIAFKAVFPGIRGELTSYYPGFSILARPDINKDIQKNSSFEIFKVQNIEDKHLLVQARFELNLYDEDGKLYRLENGLLKFKAGIKQTDGFKLR